ncbi:DUF4397 domain-containing protein [Spirosoma sordidisoli]|uniref:DUF4397 domain-containing protein n=1 Tax=Spirosoma sordidisoli TaxID=2502893 RepID=A0A4Q2UVG8_9BACT|nr:DUF4397 domain-containing protein [Spirosoma sordidisoli]RYC72011.1 DUF4397 domain-containing protein [Spirosoma sordidisoli]
MKHSFIQFIVIGAAVLLGWSCEKNTLTLPVESVTGGARVKLIHAAPEAPGVDLLIGGKKFSGFTPAGASTTNPGTPVPIRYDNTFPERGANYTIVPAGASEVTITAPATTTAGSATVISTQNLTLDDNKYYSLIVAGNAARQEVVLVNDDFSGALDPSKFYVRFVNLIAGQNYDLALSSANAPALVANLPYKGVSPFVPVDVSNNASFVLRASGSVTPIGTSLSFTNTANGRVLTIYARGIAGRTGTVAPGINIYTNR